MRCEITTSACANARSTALSSTLPSGVTPVPLGTSATARLLGNASWMTTGLPVIASSVSTTTGSGS